MTYFRVSENITNFFLTIPKQLEIMLHAYNQQALQQNNAALKC